MALLPYFPSYSLLSPSISYIITTTVIMRGLKRISDYLAFQALSIKSFLFPGYGFSSFHPCSTRMVPWSIQQVFTVCLLGVRKYVCSQHDWCLHLLQIPRPKMSQGATHWDEPLGSTLLTKGTGPQKRGNWQRLWEEKETTFTWFEVKIVFLNMCLCQEIKPVLPKGNQSWIFPGRTDAEAETPIFWPPDAKNWLIWKDPDAEKDWRQEEKGMTEDEMVGWHHQLNGYEFESTPGVGNRQGDLACCSSWGCKALDMTEWLNWTELIYTWYCFKCFPCTNLFNPHNKSRNRDGHPFTLEIMKPEDTHARNLSISQN